VKKKQPKQLPFPAAEDQEKERKAVFTVTLPVYGKPIVVEKLEADLRLALTTQYGANVTVKAVPPRKRTRKS
jgi:hypothetical protein